jgi:hypothetical protein
LPEEGIVNKALSIALVTAIEAVAFYLGVKWWFVYSPAAGVVIWTLVTYVEHFVAQNVGWLQSPFKGFPFTLEKS